MEKNHVINFWSSIPRVCLPVIGMVVLSFAAPNVGIAQESETVTLRFADGQDSISGKLTDFKEGRFFVEASIGLVAIPMEGVSCIGDACPEETRLKIENASVTLTSRDGSVTITGDLIEIKDNKYVLATSAGEHSIATDVVNCEGELCLPPVAEQPDDGTIELTNGEVSLKGKLLSFANNEFIIESDEWGEVRVNADEFDCRGASCP